MLVKLPQHLQTPIGTILRSYVFDYHSFQLSRQQFRKLLNGSLERKNSFNSSFSPQKSLAESFLRSESSMWLTRGNSIRSVSSKKKRLKSYSPKKRRTYQELYHRKKSVESETWKRSSKLFDKIDSKMQSFSVFTEKSMVMEKSAQIEKPVHSDYKMKYSNFNELVKIRQKHLALCNKYKK